MGMYLCHAVRVGSQCELARFACRHLWGIRAAVSVGSQCVVARFARRRLTGICANVVSILSPLYMIHQYYSLPVAPAAQLVTIS